MLEELIKKWNAKYYHMDSIDCVYDDLEQFILSLKDFYFIVATEQAETALWDEIEKGLRS